MNEPTKEQILKSLVEEAIEQIECGNVTGALELLKEIKKRLERE